MRGPGKIVMMPSFRQAPVRQANRFCSAASLLDKYRQILSLLLTIIYTFERLTAPVATISVRPLATLGEGEDTNVCTCTACDCSSPLGPPAALTVQPLAPQCTKTAPATRLSIVDASRHRSVAALAKAPPFTRPLSCGSHVKFPRTLHGLVSLPPDLSLRSGHLSPNHTPTIAGLPALHCLCLPRWVGDHRARHEVCTIVPKPRITDTPRRISHKNERRTTVVIESKPSP